MDVPDPLNVLRSVLGTTNAEIEQSNYTQRPRKLVKDIDFGNASLEDFANAQESTSEQNVISVPAHHDERQKLEDLHKDIASCDEVLKSVESYLTRFQAELGQVSREIENLQNRSIEMNAKLENRKKVEKILGPAVEEISISPLTVRTIAEGPVDDNWIKALKELETRSKVVDSKLTSSEGRIKAVEDVKPLLDDLKRKAIERIRDFTVAQVKAIRSPNINAQILQQQTFLKYKHLYAFLARNHNTLADEIGQAYINTMRWYYNQNFTRYHAALSSLQTHAVDQHDLIGTESSTSRRTTTASGKPTLASHDAFNIGRRAEILKSTSSAITSYLASETKTPQYMEIPFQNFNTTLIDNVCFEYGITAELFSTTKTFQQVSRKSTEIFEPVFSLGQSLTKSLVETSTDCLGVLLCVRLNQHYAFELQRRKCPVAESYINATNMLLWPRFQQIMDLHCESLKKASSTASTSTARNATNATLSSLVNSSSSSAADSSSVAPHIITQRFGQFLHGILVLSSEAGDDEPVSNSLNRLRNEYDAFVTKLSKSVGGASDQRKRQRFLENQYSLIRTIVGDVEGKLAEEVKAGLDEKLKNGAR